MAPVLVHIMYTDMYTCNSKVSHFSADGTVISGSQGFKAFYDTSVPGTILEILVTSWLLQLITMLAGY